MADKTFGVKVSQDLYDKTQLMMEESGLTNKEWFEKAVALAEQNELKEGSPEHKPDLAELETHTTRIYELVSNMVKRSIFLKDQEVNVLQEELSKKETTIGGFQEKAQVAEQATQEMEEIYRSMESEQQVLSQDMKELRSTNANNLDLINEYKEKIDTLSSLVNEYQSYKDENITLKAFYTDENAELQSQIAEGEKDRSEKMVAVEALQKEVETLHQFNQEEIKRIQEKERLEQDKMLLENDRKHHQTIQQLNTENNKTIRSLYDEMNLLRKEHEADKKDLRKDYENKIEALQTEDTE